MKPVAVVRGVLGFKRLVWLAQPCDVPDGTLLYADKQPSVEQETVKALQEQIAAYRTRELAYREELIRLAGQFHPINTGREWVRAVDEEMVSSHLGVAEGSDTYEVAREKLKLLIQWHVQVDRDLNPDRNPTTYVEDKDGRNEDI